MRSRANHRLWTVPVLIVAACLMAAACGGSDKKAVSTSSSAPTTAPPTFPAGTAMANIQARGKLITGIKFDQPGVGLRNPTNNAYEGFDVEIAKLMAVGIFGGTPETLGNKIEFVEAVSANREPFLQNGNVDIVVASYTINDARKQQVDFAGPYLIAHQDILVKTSDNSIKTVTDLNGQVDNTEHGGSVLWMDGLPTMIGARPPNPQPIRRHGSPRWLCLGGVCDPTRAAWVLWHGLLDPLAGLGDGDGGAGAGWQRL